MKYIKSKYFVKKTFNITPFFENIKLFHTSSLCASILNLTLIIMLSQFYVGSANAMRAGKWYEYCSMGLVLTAKEYKNIDPKLRLNIRRCQIIAIKVWCSDSYEGGYAIKTDKERAKAAEILSRYCPRYSSIPFGGPYVIAVKYWENRGGIPFWKNWHSAESIIREAFEAKWPECAKMRKVYKYNNYTRDMIDKCIKGWERIVNDNMNE